MEVENNVEENEPVVESEKPSQEVSKSPENPPVEDEEEPPAKKSKVAEEALKKIEAAKLLKEKEKQEAEEKAKNAHKNELDKFWKTVKDDPTDFTGWTHLLQFVDGKNEVEAGEEAFQAFLKRYPYCYGYWKKFADFQKRNGTPEKVMEVFDQGTAAIPLSTDLWIHYLNHCKAVKKDDAAFIRREYERAMSSCGREWRSDKLWDHYVKWEGEEKNYPEVFQLYQRMLKIPTHGLARNYEAFIALMKEHNPKELMDTVDFLILRKEVIAAKTGEGESSKDTDAAPGEDTESELKSAEETQAMREKIVFNVKKVFKDTEDKMRLRVKYEEGIKRPYFHVKPLERGQLKNWNDYIDFMKREMSKEGGDITEVEILYERSLIACALYEEFWTNYISWWESREGDNTDKIRSIYSRACINHLPTKVDLHEQWAAFEEIQGDFDAASKILENLEKAHPELISLLMRRINLERRRRNDEKVCELYETAIKASPSKTTASEISIKFARFLRLHQKNATQACKVIKTALETDPTNPKLYLQHVDILINNLPVDVPQVVAVLDKALEQEMPDKQKLLFSQRKVEFLEDFGDNISSLQTAKNRHMEFLTKVKEGIDKETEASAENKNGSSNGSSTTYPAVSNSSSYTAQQAQAYNNYGSRYASYPQNYGQQYGGSGY